MLSLFSVRLRYGLIEGNKRRIVSSVKYRKYWKRANDPKQNEVKNDSFRQLR